MRFAPLALALVLFGCHDYIVDPPEPVQPPEPQPVPELPALTLKGSDEVAVGTMQTYKAGHMNEEVTYHFQINDSTPVLFSRDEDLDRYFETEVVGQGRVELRVTAYSESGVPVAFARRWITAH